MSKILVTGAAGFIGYHLSRRLLADGHDVIGLDNLNGYYDVGLKQARLKQLENQSRFRFFKIDIADAKSMAELFAAEKFDTVANLAAQAGVRYSLKNPTVYIDSNVVGFLNVLEGCRWNHVKHLVFASSSSVYGANTAIPFSTHQSVDHPVSLYAATKKANELMAHSYAALFGLPCTGLRFFTAYGPWGRPDMAIFLFTKAIFEDRPIDVFNFGEMKRDFTYVDDIVTGVIRVLSRIPAPDPGWSGEHPDPASSFAPYRLYNIGNSQAVLLSDLIDCLERVIGKKARKNFLPMQPGDLPVTFADVEDLERETGYRPSTRIEDGVRKFVEWYRDYYRV